MQIYAMPVFDMLETLLVKKLNFNPTWYLRFVTRNIYVGMYLVILLVYSSAVYKYLQ